MKKKIILSFLCILFIIIIVFLVNAGIKKKRFEENLEYYHAVVRSLYYYPHTNVEDLEKNTIGYDEDGLIAPFRTKMILHYYNYYNDMDVSYDELIDEFKAYCYNERKSKYKILLDYAEYYENNYIIYSEERSVDRIGIKSYLDMIKEYMFDKHAEDEGFDLSKLSDEEIEYVCVNALKNKEKLYLATEYNDNIRSFDLSYDLFYDDFEEEQLSTDENGEKYYKVSDSEIYYLKYGNIDLVTDEDVWYVYKVKLSGNSDKSVFFSEIGDTTDSIKSEPILHSDYDEPIELVSETPDEIVCAVGPFYATYSMKDGKCDEILLEIKE